MQNKARTQEISALGHFLIQNSSGPVNETCFYQTKLISLIYKEGRQELIWEYVIHRVS